MDTGWVLLAPPYKLRARGGVHTDVDSTSLTAESRYGSSHLAMIWYIGYQNTEAPLPVSLVLLGLYSAF